VKPTDSGQSNNLQDHYSKAIYLLND